MKVLTFVAEDAQSAISQILQELGPDAQIVGIRKVPASGLARLWKRYSRVEVLASLPEEAGPQSAIAAAPPLNTAETSPAAQAQMGRRFPDDEGPFSNKSLGNKGASLAVLEKMGMLPPHAERVLERAEDLRPNLTSASLAEELALLRGALQSFWNPGLADSTSNEGPHVFLGPPGSGKTTILCKWLAQKVLTQGKTARVWRLDLTRANTAELLSVHCAILGCEEERSWKAGTRCEADGLAFVDLPGVMAQDRTGMDQLANLLRQIGNPSLHLVLNGAYEVSLLLDQIQAFSVLPIRDLILTHLDEETRWTKLWNLVLGTKYTLRYLGAGQNIPGDFFPATPELLMGQQFWPSDGRNSPNSRSPERLAKLLLNDEA